MKQYWCQPYIIYRILSEQKYRECNYIMSFLLYSQSQFLLLNNDVTVLSVIYSMLCTVYKLEKLSWEEKFILRSLKYLLATLAFSYTYLCINHSLLFSRKTTGNGVRFSEKKTGSFRNKNPAKQLRHHKSVCHSVITA